MAAAKAAKKRETSFTTRETDLDERENAIKGERDRIADERRSIQEDRTRNGNERFELERRIKALETREKDLLGRADRRRTSVHRTDRRGVQEGAR